MKALEYLKRLRKAYEDSCKLDNPALRGLVYLYNVTQLDAAISELEEDPDYDAVIAEALSEVPKA